MTHAEFEAEPADVVQYMLHLHKMYRRLGIDPVGGGAQIHVG